MTTLAERIDETRLTYTGVEHGVRIKGSPFVIEFDTPVDPREWIDEVTTAEAPWRMFGVTTELDEEYYSVACVLFHVENGDLDGATKVDLEVGPRFVRVYVKGEDADAERVAEFVQTVLDEYEAEVRFNDEA